MTIAGWCVLAAGLMPMLFVVVAKAGGERYDNRDPRAWIAKQGGRSQRAYAAHLNSYEALPLFAAAVLLAQQAGAPQDRIDMLAIAFIVLRLIYGALYIANMAAMRSLVWALALACCVGLFVIAA